MDNSRQIKSFKDLNVWQEAHKLVLLVYNVAITFPKEEVYGLTLQLKRAAVSITSNIAEGFSRESYKEKAQFYSMAHGSLTELENQLLIALDVEYLKREDFDKIDRQLVSVHKLLNAFIKSTKEFVPNSRFQIPDSNKGFTLIEAVVAASVFAFVMTSILGIYLAMMRLDNRTRAERAVQENARYIVEFVAKELRTGRVDYASYPGGSTSGRTDLWVINQEGIRERIYLSGSNLVLDRPGVGSSNLNSNTVLVTRAAFSILPSTDPFTSAKTTNVQPHATLLLGLTSNYGQKIVEVARINLQTTYSSRYYPAR